MDRSQNKAFVQKIWNGYKKLIGDKWGEWRWCLHCERAYRIGKFRYVNGLYMCPYSDCAGDAVIDIWSWEQIREHNEGYPEIPTEKIVYRLYGDKENENGNL